MKENRYGDKGSLCNELTLIYVRQWVGNTLRGVALLELSSRSSITSNPGHTTTIETAVTTLSYGATTAISSHCLVAIWAKPCHQQRPPAP